MDVTLANKAVIIMKIMIIAITSKQGAQCFPKTPKESDQKEILGGISLKRILSTYCALSCCKV